MNRHQKDAAYGGGGVIRTREGRIRPLTAFEAVPFVHSGTPPPGV
jgi:threonine aldolase